jgi:alpha/beta superfamily hydrolase
MKPHFFGDDDARLYGIYAEARAAASQPRAVLACYPIAGEYMRAHRAFRQLTTLLTRKGVHVMRFDYFGTGDSLGDFDDASVARWRADIGAASAELRELSGASHVAAVGLRLGATMALLASEELPEIDQVVLWDPIVDGAAYVRELESKHVEEQTGRRGDASTSGMIGVNGFGLPRAVRDEIAAIDLRSWLPQRALRTDLVVSGDEPEWAAMRDHLAEVDVPHHYELSPSVGDWGEADEFGSALLPQQIIQSIVTCLTEAKSEA